MLKKKKKKKKKIKGGRTSSDFKWTPLSGFRLNFQTHFLHFVLKKKAAADAEKTFFPSSSTVIDIYM